MLEGLLAGLLPVVVSAGLVPDSWVGGVGADGDEPLAEADPVGEPLWLLEVAGSVTVTSRVVLVDGATVVCVCGAWGSAVRKRAVTVSVPV